MDGKNFFLLDVRLAAVVHVNVRFVIQNPY